MGPDSNSENAQGQNPSAAEIHEVKTNLINHEDFNSLFADIHHFNSQFSMGSLMFSAFKEQLSEDEVAVKPDEQTQQLTASGIGLIHEGILRATGLEVEPVSGKNATMYSSEGNTGVGELRVNIGNRDDFVNFLQEIDPQATKESEFGKNLKNLSDILTQQIYDHYNLEDPSDEALQLLGSLDQIVKEYKRLGIPEIERLEEYLVHSKKGDLKEFIHIEKRSLLSEPGKSFGPADWQKDASPDFLRSRWEDALQTLQRVRENPNAQDLYNQLFENLSNSLKLAEEDLNTPGRDERHQEYKDRLKPVLIEIKQKFG